jgi:hypothetical protein
MAFNIDTPTLEQICLIVLAIVARARPVFSLAFLARWLVPVLADCTQKNYKINRAYRY